MRGGVMKLLSTLGLFGTCVVLMVPGKNLCKYATLFVVLLS
jgi:hypothetical protein